MTATVEAPERTALADMVVVDADVHVNDTPGALAPYCDYALADVAGRTGRRSLPLPASARLRAEPAARSAHPRWARHPLGEHGGRDARRAERAGDRHRHPLPRPHAPLRRASRTSSTRPRWPTPTTAGWSRNGCRRRTGCTACVLACAAEPGGLRRGRSRSYAKEDRIVGVYLPTAGVNPLWGHRKYDPILAAAEAADLPVCLHSVTVVSPAFPCQLDQFENHFARQVLSHSFAMMANLTSIMHTGRAGALSRSCAIVFTEAGIAWVPYMIVADGQVLSTSTAAWCRSWSGGPSDYIRERMWFATQPIEEPDDPRTWSTTIDLRRRRSGSSSPPTGRTTTSTTRGRS